MIFGKAARNLLCWRFNEIFELHLAPYGTTTIPFPALAVLKVCGNHQFSRIQSSRRT